MEEAEIEDKSDQLQMKKTELKTCSDELEKASLRIAGNCAIGLRFGFFVTNLSSVFHAL